LTSHHEEIPLRRGPWPVTLMVSAGKELEQQFFFTSAVVWVKGRLALTL
jgi:hypothetical protein